MLHIVISSSIKECKARPFLQQRHISNPESEVKPKICKLAQKRPKLVEPTHLLKIDKSFVKTRKQKNANLWVQVLGITLESSIAGVLLCSDQRSSQTSLNHHYIHIRVTLFFLQEIWDNCEIQTGIHWLRPHLLFDKSETNIVQTQARWDSEGETTRFSLNHNLQQILLSISCCIIIIVMTACTAMISEYFGSCSWEGISALELSWGEGSRK